MRDISNIFDLPPEELEKKLNSPRSLWTDTAPQIRDFATNLSKFIMKADTPYVLALDGGYGTGKTHFSSRFSILMDKQIKTVYFSVWEQDYTADPFIVFAEQITGIVRKFSEDETFVEKILASAAEATTVRANFSLFGLINIETETSGEKFINKLFPEKQRSFLFAELKNLLTEFITSLPHRKLVLIVDELDRCRPDYAVKVLETIKHFFDIKGLIFILPINSKRLNAYIDGFYHIQSDKIIGKEDYLQKFINQTIDVPELNYLKICESKIKLSEFGNNVSNIDCAFDSIQELQKWIAEYAKAAGLSYRETIEIIKRAKVFCKKYPEPIRCRLLAHRLCNKVFQQHNKNYSDYMSFGNNYAYTTNTGYNDETEKKRLLRADAFNSNAFLDFGNEATTEEINNIRLSISKLRCASYSYADIFSTIDRILEKLNLIDIDGYSPPTGYYIAVTKEKLRQKIQENKNFLEKTKCDLLDFQYKTGSDDKDDERLKEYDKVIKDPTTLYK